MANDYRMVCGQGNEMIQNAQQEQKKPEFYSFTIERLYVLVADIVKLAIQKHAKIGKPISAADWDGVYDHLITIDAPTSLLDAVNMISLAAEKLDAGRDDIAAGAMASAMASLSTYSGEYIPNAAKHALESVVSSMVRDGHHENDAIPLHDAAHIIRRILMGEWISDEKAKFKAAQSILRNADLSSEEKISIRRFARSAMSAQDVNNVVRVLKALGAAKQSN